MITDMWRAVMLLLLVSCAAHRPDRVVPVRGDWTAMEPSYPERKLTRSRFAGTWPLTVEEAGVRVLVRGAGYAPPEAAVVLEVGEHWYPVNATARRHASTLGLCDPFEITPDGGRSSLEEALGRGRVRAWAVSGKRQWRRLKNEMVIDLPLLSPFSNHGFLLMEETLARPIRR